MPIDDDRRAIARLVHGYGVAIDGAEPDALARPFTADGVLSTATRLLRGAAEIGSVIPEIRRLFPRTMHQMSTHDSAVDGDIAQGTTCGTAFHLKDLDAVTAECLEIVVRYWDRYARAPDGWRIAERQLDVLFTRTYIVSRVMTPLLTVGTKR